MNNLVDNVIDEIKRNNKMHSSFLESSLALLNEKEKELLNQYLCYCEKNGTGMDFLAESYNLIVNDTLKEQVYFKRHKKYRYSTFDEVESLVYRNDEYMKKYMHGLAISSFLWPNHSVLRRFFERTIPKSTPGSYLEIGPGHGLYFMLAMNLSLFTTFEGIDISPTSVALTKSILESGVFGSYSSYNISQCDFMEMGEETQYDAIVAGEVLEHVEKPMTLLNKIHSLAKNNSYIFITTCVNAPEIDHIYLFQNLQQVDDLISGARFRIRDRLAIHYSGYSIEESERQKIPINIGLVLQKE